MAHDNVLRFVGSVASRPCACRYDAGVSSSGTYDPVTGRFTPGINQRGPCTYVCDGCRARQALEADGAPVPAAGAPPLLVAGDGTTACRLPPGTTCVVEAQPLTEPCGTYGCRLHKPVNAVFCASCLQEYLEDSDAFK